MPKLRIAKEFLFDAAHFLPNYHGKCERMHGHTYKLRVIVEGPIRKDGLVMDFMDIKKVVNERIVEKLDHSTINDTIKNASVENMCVWVWKQLKPKIKGLVEVRIWETPNSFAVYSGS